MYSSNGIGPSGATSLAAALTGLVALQTVNLRCPPPHPSSPPPSARTARPRARMRPAAEPLRVTRIARPVPIRTLPALPTPPRHPTLTFPAHSPPPAIPNRSYNRVCDDGAAAFAVGVAPLTALRRLDLWYAARPRGQSGEGGGGGSEENAAVRKGSRGGRDGGVRAGLRWWVWADDEGGAGRRAACPSLCGPENSSGFEAWAAACGARRRGA